MAKTKKVTRVRNNDTGEFAKKETAKTDPKGTTVETVKRKAKKLTVSQLDDAVNNLFGDRPTFSRDDITAALQCGYKLGIK